MSHPQEESSEIGQIVFIVESSSARETKSWGRRLASLLEGGELLGLTGELGAGKTCFVKGLARGLSLREEDILSPTFTMIQEHRGRLSSTISTSTVSKRSASMISGCASICLRPEWRPSNGSSACAKAPELDFLSVRIEYAGASAAQARVPRDGRASCGAGCETQKSFRVSR